MSRTYGISLEYITFIICCGLLLHVETRKPLSIIRRYFSPAGVAFKVEALSKCALALHTDTALHTESKAIAIWNFVQSHNLLLRLLLVSDSLQKQPHIIKFKANYLTKQNYKSNFRLYTN